MVSTDCVTVNFDGVLYSAPILATYQQISDLRMLLISPLESILFLFVNYGRVKR